MFRTALRWAAAAIGAAAAILLVLLFKPIPVTVAPISPRASTQYWAMPGGYRIAYSQVPRATGVAAKAPVIFVHGGPGGYIHSSIIRTLSGLSAQGRDVYFYDQSGTGLSDRRANPKATTVDGHVADIELIRRKIGAPQVVLIGQSFGSFLASLYAADHPTRVERIVLGSPGNLRPDAFDLESRFPVPQSLKFNPPAGYVEATSATNMPLRGIASFTLAQLFDIRLASDRELDAAVNSMATNFTRTMVCDPRHVLAEEGGAGAYSRVGSNFFPDNFRDRRPAMRKVQAPVLVLHGECDFIPYSDAMEYVATFPNARYRFMPGAGHILWWDRPADYAEEIAAFLAD